MSKLQFVSFLLFLSVPAIACAQQPAATAAPAAQNGEGRIELDVVVTDKSGKPISGLDIKDFTLQDNNQPGKILSFHAFDATNQESGAPVEAFLLLDTLSVPTLQVSLTRMEMEKFLRQNGGHLAHPVSIFVLTQKGITDPHAPTTDGNALAAALDQVDIAVHADDLPAGAAGDMQRLGISIQMLKGIASNGAKMPGRKLLIWAGPGWPTPDSGSIDINAQGHQHFFDLIVELTNRLREARIDLFSISTGDSDLSTFFYQSYLKGIKQAAKANPPNLGLKVLATQSGGRALIPTNELVSQINSCLAEADAYYTLTFDPPHAEHADDYHDLKIQVDKPGLKVRTNTGYYNQP